MNVCIVQPCPTQISETFLQAHAERLPGELTVVHGKRARIGAGRASLWEGLMQTRFAVERVLRGQPKQWEYTQSYARLLRQLQPEVVIAQYGVSGVHVMDACRQLDVPLVVHFRGFDIWHGATFEQHRESYPRLFQRAAALVAVSRSIQRRLISLGAAPEKVHYNPSGANCERFGGARPGEASPVFLSVGRFTEKKAPHLTILAFREVHRERPEARLRMIGKGPLREFCETLVEKLRLHDAVTFLGAQTHEVVQAEMRRARAFVQHSITASSGDAEGTPTAVQEAGASGLPTVATRHGGINEVVLEGETGLLVDEFDVRAMAEAMLRLAEDPRLAERMGRAGRDRVVAHFSQQKSLKRLWSIAQWCVGEKRGLESRCNKTAKDLARPLAATK